MNAKKAKDSGRWERANGRLTVYRMEPPRVILRRIGNNEQGLARVQIAVVSREEV
jgi:hypothetical protein